MLAPRPLSWLGSILLLIVLLAPAARAQNCGDLSEDWFGTWDTLFTLADCELGFVFLSVPGQDVICGNDCFDVSDEGCSITAEGNTVSLECSSTEEVEAGCQMTYTMTMAFTLDGDAIAGSGQQIYTYTGDCSPEYQDGCADVEFSATRTGDATVCQVPTGELLWSDVKAMFR